MKKTSILYPFVAIALCAFTFGCQSEKTSEKPQNQSSISKQLPVSRNRSRKVTYPAPFHSFRWKQQTVRLLA